MKRTAEEIREAIREACGEAFEYDEEGRQMRDQLIKRAIWNECAPTGGWYRDAKTRLVILDTMPEPDDENAELFGDSPKAMAEEIRKCINNQWPFNIEATDNYIEEKTGRRP